MVNLILYKVHFILFINAQLPEVKNDHDNKVSQLFQKPGFRRRDDLVLSFRQGNSASWVIPIEFVCPPSLSAIGFELASADSPVCKERSCPFPHPE